MKIAHVLVTAMAAALIACAGASTDDGSPPPGEEAAPQAAPAAVHPDINCPVSYDCDAPNGDVLGTFGSIGACSSFCSTQGGVCRRVFC